jgi:hypothetical protein
MPDPLDMSDPSHPLHQMALQMQQRHQMDARRQAIAQALMPQQSQGPAPVGNSSAFQMPQAPAASSGMAAMPGAIGGMRDLAYLMRGQPQTPFSGAPPPAYGPGQQALQTGPVVPGSGVTISGS